MHLEGDTLLPALLAALTVLLVATYHAVRARALRGRTAALTETFFTLHAVEEPTRAYVPYTGTVPLGPWGAKPWIEHSRGMSPPRDVGGCRLP